MEKQKFILGETLDSVYSSEYRELSEPLNMELENLYKILERLLENNSITNEEFHLFEDGFNIHYRNFIQYLNTLDMNINILIQKP